MWGVPKIGVPPNHPILIGFSLINHLFWGTPIYETPLAIENGHLQIFIVNLPVKNGAFPLVNRYITPIYGMQPQKPSLTIY